MKFVFFCLFLVSIAFSVNCITRRDAATWTGLVVIQATSGEWAAEPEEFSPRSDGGVCDQINGHWAIINVKNDGAETAGGPVICTPDSRVLPVGEHSLSDYILSPNTCPMGYTQGSIFDATVFFDSHAVGVGRTFKAYYRNPRSNYAREEVVVSPNLANPRYGYELEFFRTDVFVDNPANPQEIEEVLCVRHDAKFTFAWAGHNTFSTRAAKDAQCSNVLNSNYRAATLGELSSNIKSFFSYEDIKEYAKGFTAADDFDVGTPIGNDPPIFPDNYRGIANGIVVADDACRTYLPTYGEWEISPECDEIENIADDVCVCNTAANNCNNVVNCTAAAPNYRSTAWNPLEPDFLETEVPILSVHDNRYSRVIWQNEVTCLQDDIVGTGINDECVHRDTGGRTVVYGCRATEIGAQSTTDTRVLVPLACIWDPQHTVTASEYTFNDDACVFEPEFVPPTWSFARGFHSTT